MPTTKKRINISVSEAVERALELLAKRDSVPQATKASHLLERALEIEEDEVWNELAEKRDVRGARFIPHKQAWA